MAQYGPEARDVLVSGDDVWVADMTRSTPGRIVNRACFWRNDEKTFLQVKERATIRARMESSFRIAPFPISADTPTAASRTRFLLLISEELETLSYMTLNGGIAYGSASMGKTWSRRVCRGCSRNQIPATG